MSTVIRNVNVDRLKEGVFLKITLRKPGNSEKVRNFSALTQYIDLLTAPDGQETTEAALDLPKNFKATPGVKVTYAPIKSPALAKAIEFQNATKARLCGPLGKANPSNITDGLFIVKKSLVEEFENDLTAACKELETVHIPAAVADLIPAMDRARTTPVKNGGLGPLFSESAYPSANDYARSFRIEWQWLALGVPDDLPDTLRAQQVEKMDRQFKEASEEILSALRVGMSELIDHAVERLTTEPGAKPKVFRDTMLDNFRGFLDVFDAKNIMGDSALEQIVIKAREVTAGMEADKLRKYPNVRDKALSQFKELKALIEPMIQVKASRAFDFSDEEPATPAPAPSPAPVASAEPQPEPATAQETSPEPAGVAA